MVIVFYLLLVVWSVRLCVGFRLPHNKLSSSKNELRQMAYNGTALRTAPCLGISKLKVVI